MCLFARCVVCERVWVSVCVVQGRIGVPAYKKLGSGFAPGVALYLAPRTHTRARARSLSLTSRCIAPCAHRTEDTSPIERSDHEHYVCDVSPDRYACIDG